MNGAAGRRMSIPGAIAPANVTFNFWTSMADLGKLVLRSRAEGLKVRLFLAVSLVLIGKTSGIYAQVMLGEAVNRLQDTLDAAKAAGAKFGVSPGITDKLVKACEDEELPLLGGVATVGEAMGMLERGYDVCKFFPAEANGGAPALKAFAGPLPQMSFCPTGGVTAKNAPDYLKLPNVLCVGGSWVVEASLLKQGRWDEVKRLATEASKLER